MATIQPNATNSPHTISSNVLAYTDANGVAKQVALKPLPAPGSTFGTDANGNPNNGARVNSDGSVTIFKDGTVVDGYFLSHGVVVEANNTTISRCDIFNSLYGVKINYDNNYKGSLIVDCAIHDCDDGIYGHDFTMQRCNIYEMGEDGAVASGSNGVLLDCYIHDLGTNVGAHADGVQISSGSGWIIRGNNFDLPGYAGHLSNSCVFIESTFGPVSNIVIDGNWLNGGNYTIYSVNHGYGNPTGIEITNNYFGRGYQYGLLSIDGASAWQNNYWMDTNLLVSANGSTSPSLDTTPPVLTSVSPIDNSTNVAPSSNLVLTFSEAVVPGSGNIVIRNSNGTIAQSIPVTDSSQVSFSGNQVTINPSTDLAAGSGYYVNIASGVIHDVAGNNYAGISNSTSFNFTTDASLDTTPPVLTSVSPIDNSTNVAPSSNLVLTFSEAVVPGSGNIVIRNSNGTIAQSIPVTDSSQVSFSGNQVTINPSTDLAAGSGYYVNIASGVIHDVAGNNYAGISNSTSFNFTTDAPLDTTPPVLTSVSPIDNSTNVAPSSNLVLTFSETVVPGSGNIVIRNSNGTIAQSIPVTDSSQVSFSGNQVTINPSTDLAAGSGYYVNIASGVIHDVAGNNYAGISNSTSFNFTTDAPVDTTPPVLTSVSPIDNSTNVAPSSNLVLTFSETVVPGSGNIVIRNSNGTIAQSIPVTDSSQVSFSGNQVTINPSTDLAAGSGYYVNIASGVIHDVAGNNYAGISNSTSFNFTTDAPVSGGGGATPTNLLVNGGFETGDFTGWMLSGNVGVGSYGQQTYIFSAAQSGQYAAGLGPMGSDATLSQDLPTTAGQHYTLDFWLANASGGPDDFTVKWNGQTLLALVNEPAQGYTEYTFDVLGAAGTSHLEFDFRQDPSHWSLDSISVTPLDTTPPVLTSVSPTDNSTNVAPSSNLVLTFSETVVPGSGNIVIRNSNGTIAQSIPVTDSSQVSFSGNQVTINPSTDLAAGSGYYVNIASGVIHDVAGNNYAGISNSTSFNFTTDAPVSGGGGATPTTSLFSASDTPTSIYNDGQQLEVGVQFQSSVAGQITGLKFYRSASDTGPDVLTLWTATGTKLASVTYTNTAASGWQTAALSTPVAISANTSYVASYHTTGYYVATSYFFDTAFTSGVLTAPEGVYAYGGTSTTGIFPTNTFRATNYWADVVFEASAAPAGAAGEAISLGLTNPTDHLGSVAVNISAVPSAWILSEGTKNGDGTWTVQTNDIAALSITSPKSYTGALVLNVAESWVNADGSSGNAVVADNVEVYAKGAPIFAISGDDNLSGSSGDDLFVLAQPIGNDTIYKFNVAHDRVDLLGFSGMSGFVDVQTRLSDNSNGDAVVTIAEGKSITFDGVSATSLAANNFVFNRDTVMDNANSIVIGDNAVLPLAGTVNNSGTIELASIGGQTRLQVLANGLTLEGGGHVDFSDSNSNIIVGTTPGTTLTNVDNTISGAGQLGEGQLRLDNGGTIIASGGNALTIDTAANAIVNSGTLEAVGSGGLDIHSDISNFGLLWANGGSITIDGDVSGTGSALINGAALFELGGAFGENVKLDTDANATLKIDHAADFSGTVVGFDDNDALDLADLAFDSTTLSYAANSSNTGGTLTVSDGTHTANIALLGQYMAADFVMSANGFGGTVIHDSPPATLTQTLTHPQHACR